MECLKTDRHGHVTPGLTHDPEHTKTRKFPGNGPDVPGAMRRRRDGRDIVGPEGPPAGHRPAKQRKRGRARKAVASGQVAKDSDDGDDSGVDYQLPRDAPGTPPKPARARDFQRIAEEAKNDPNQPRTRRARQVPARLRE